MKISNGSGIDLKFCESKLPELTVLWATRSCCTSSPKSTSDVTTEHGASESGSSPDLLLNLNADERIRDMPQAFRLVISTLE